MKRLISRDIRVRTRNPLYQFMHPVHLQLHDSCLGSVAGEAAPKKEAAKSSIRGLTDRVFHSLNIKVCTFQSNFVALNGQQVRVMCPLFSGHGFAAQPGVFNFTMKYITQPLKTMQQLRTTAKKKKNIFLKNVKKKIILGQICQAKTIWHEKLM